MTHSSRNPVPGCPCHACRRARFARSTYANNCRRRAILDRAILDRAIRDGTAVRCPDCLNLFVPTNGNVLCPDCEDGEDIEMANSRADEPNLTPEEFDALGVD